MRFAAGPSCLATNNDITERKRAEEALHQARTELAHVTRVTTLGELAASIAHDINQPRLPTMPPGRSVTIEDAGVGVPEAAALDDRRPAIDGARLDSGGARRSPDGDGG